jgi:hypothetical protein
MEYLKFFTKSKVNIFHASLKVVPPTPPSQTVESAQSSSKATKPVSSPTAQVSSPTIVTTPTKQTMLPPVEAIVPVPPPVKIDHKLLTNESIRIAVKLYCS